MKRVFSLVLAMAAISVVAPAESRAQGLNLSAVQTANDPLTGLSPDQWVKLATNLVNGKAVVGKPEIFMINATGKELSAVTCDSKWQLVGPNPYVKSAPGSLPTWKVTLVPTEGFDGYCKISIVAQSDDGTLYKANLVSTDGTFTNATFLTFRLPQN